MKKLLAIMMALVMCCSLVVSASAEEYDGELFWMDIDMDGTWTEYDVWDVYFETDNSDLEVYVYYDGEVDGTLEEFFYSEMADAEEIYYDDMDDVVYFEDGEIDGCPAFCLDYYGEEGYISSIILILTDNYVYEIEIYADEMEYDYLWEAVMNITVWDVYSGEDYVDEEEEIIEEEEIEEEEEEDKKPSKNDKNDKDDKDDEDDKKDKKSKKDKDEDDEDEDKDNTTLIIIIVAGVAVVAIAAVVIVLVTKKKD